MGGWKEQRWRLGGWGGGGEDVEEKSNRGERPGDKRTDGVWQY